MIKHDIKCDQACEIFTYGHRHLEFEVKFTIITLRETFTQLESKYQQNFCHLSFTGFESYFIIPNLYILRDLYTRLHHEDEPVAF